MDKLATKANTDTWAKWKRRRRSVSEEDLAHILEQRDAINRKFAPDGSLAQFTEDVTLLFSLVHDYCAGTYLDVPWATVAGAVAALEVALDTRQGAHHDRAPASAASRSEECTRVALCLAAVEWEVLEYKRWLVRASCATPRD